MSARRALDAGIPPWVALAAAIPDLNYLLFLWLCLMPSRAPGESKHPEDDTSQSQSTELPESISALRSGLWGMLSAGGLGLVLLLLNVYGLEDYGSLLFFGTPLMMGVVMGGVFNTPLKRSVFATIGVALLTMTVASFFLLCSGLEGAICILMALPLAMPVCVIGAVLGRWLVSLEYTGTGLPWGAMLILPIMAGAETLLEQTPEYVVLTSVEIDAPPETVWKNVIHFPDLPEPEEWYFRAGIACPTGARIEGSGAGAVRRCLFTTGTFVEPITAWEPGRRLAFNVTEQPDPMFELSPYRDLHPPHLQGYLICRRGEFRLVALPDGGSRLEGRTWYTFNMHPQSYWTLWSRFFIRRIHRRVLLHVKGLSEKDASPSADKDREPAG